MMLIQRVRMLLAAVSLLASLWFVPAAVRAAGSIEAEVALETTLENRLRGILTDLLGSDDVIVIVNATLRADGDPGQEREEVLPGVPAKDLAGGARPPVLVSRLATVIIIEEGLGEKDVAAVREAATSLLGVDAKRGDTLEIRKQRFLDRQVRRDGPFTMEKLLKPPHLWNVLWLSIALIAALTLPRGLAAALRMLAEAVRSLHMEQAAAASKEKEPQQEGLGPALAAAAAGVPAPLPAKPRVEESARGKDQPFGFIREAHLQRLVYLMRRAPPEIVAVVIHYIPNEMASNVLAALEPEVRTAVTASLGQVVELTEANVRKIEQYVASKIDFLVGGEERLLEILDEASPEVQSQILESISGRDTALAQTLRGRMVQLEDLGGLDATEIQHVMRRFPLATLGALLLPHPEILHRMAEKLPQGLAQRLTQEVDLARPLPNERRLVETRRLIDMLKQLEEEGWISFKKVEVKK